MKTYLIIGASSGIGKALAISLAAEGHKVIGTYNTTEPDSELSNITMQQYNVLDNEPFNLQMEAIDGLVYCPGAINLKPFARTKADEYLQDYRLQVVGAVNIIQQVLPVLKKGVNPSIVLFSTVAVGHGFAFHSIVSASKGAVEGLTKSLAAELSPTIRVNCIAPSLTNTPLAKHLLGTDEKLQANAARHPMKAIGEATDIAEMAKFLLSEKAKWITGQIIAVDGGMSSLKV